MEKIVKIAHVSDPHFYCRSALSVRNVFSKRLLGNLNLLLTRRKSFGEDQLRSLPKFLKSLEVSCVVVTGDCSTTSYPEELKRCYEWLEEFITVGIEVIVVPGNHDAYTPDSVASENFYKCLGNKIYSRWENCFNYSLKKDRICAFCVEDPLWIVALDTAIATPIFCSLGRFSKTMMDNLIDLLKNLCDKNVIMINHYPIMRREFFLRKMIGEKMITKVIKDFPNVDIYLHGHTHRAHYTKLKHSHVIDSGSCSSTKNGEFSLLDICIKEGKKMRLSHSRYSYDCEKGYWRCYDSDA